MWDLDIELQAHQGRIHIASETYYSGAVSDGSLDI
jgi:hypothetical protein